ncbi:MAG: membrane protein insertase YidC [Clostridiales bacterium]|nr:membrane protein insertase YidC [Clostridiales bacterium]
MFDFITKPFGWLMMVLFEFTKNYGLAVILFALVVKVILLPFQMKSKRSMMRTSRLQPRMKELEKKHGANKQKYQEEVQKLYKEEHINPMSGCLWSLIPFPIIIALFSAIRQPLTIMMGIAQELIAEGGIIYNKIVELATANAPDKLAVLTNLKDSYIQIKQAQFISQPGNFEIFSQISDKLRQVDYNFLGMDLGAQPDWQFFWKTNWSDSSVWGPALLLFLLPIASGILSYFSSKVSMQMNPSAGGQQQSSNKTMLLMMPLISVFFAFSMPGAIGVYIIASTLFAMIQDIYLTKHYTKIMDAEDAVKNEQLRIKEAELEAKRLETERKKLENKTEVNPNTSKKKQQKIERQEQVEKAVEWEKKTEPAQNKEEDPSRSGSRRYARGRAYDPDRFSGSSEENPEEQSDDAPAQELASGVSDKEGQNDEETNESSITDEGDDSNVEID